MTIKNMKMFLAMRDLFYGGEFAHWISQQEVPLGAWKEYGEAWEYFSEETGFVPPEEENDT